MSISSRIPDAINLVAAASILGVGTRTLRRGKFGRQLPIERDPLTNLPYVRRGPLLAYMAGHGYPDLAMRKLMTRPYAPVLSLGVPARERARLKGVRLTPVGGPVCLGRRLAATPPKAVVFGVEWLPPGQGERWAEEVRRLDDSPAVLALCSYDPPGDLFDRVIRPDASPAEVRSILAAVPATRRKSRRKT